MENVSEKEDASGKTANEVKAKRGNLKDGDLVLITFFSLIMGSLTAFAFSRSVFALLIMPLPLLMGLFAFIMFFVRLRSTKGVFKFFWLIPGFLMFLCAVTSVLVSGEYEDYAVKKLAVLNSDIKDFHKENNRYPTQKEFEVLLEENPWVKKHIRVRYSDDIIGYSDDYTYRLNFSLPRGGGYFEAEDTGTPYFYPVP